MRNKIPAVLSAIPFLLLSCTKQIPTFTPEERNTADSLVRGVHDIDSMAQLQQRLESEGNRLGSIVALREWGKMLRNESRFDEALARHSKGLQQAEAAGDTLEWVQALNHIGTDYRRMGVLDVAQEYHQRARTLSEQHSDTSFTARKNSVVSLNGLGNIYMSLGNYDRADSVLRLALAGERQLGSTIGQAINYANLGGIFEHRGQRDSAWVYYRLSMALNQEAGSTLGISLCHTYFGSLYEKNHQYDRAMQEYERAYELMKASKDEWHALNSLIALASIHHTTHNSHKTKDYLEQAQEIAERIKSPEHLQAIHTLYYKHHKAQGNPQAALASYEQAIAMQDSTLDIEKMNRIQNASLNTERERQMRLTNEAQLKLEKERAIRSWSFGVFVLLVVLLSGLVGMLLYVQRLRDRNHRALRQMATLRENFFTNVTHEFRTPLTLILGLSHDLKNPANYPASVTEKAETIERQGQGLLTLINQLLDMSKIKAAVGNPGWRHGNVTAQLAMIAESYHDYARSRNIDLQFLAQESVEMDFVPDYLNKVMNNLLSNSFKFTPEYGKVNVSVWRKGERLHISVTDTGQGMTEEVMRHAFEPFYQAECEASKAGTGVGLALVKQIMEVLKGKIEVKSALGKGTTFLLSLPIHHHTPHAAAEGMEANLPLLPKTSETPADSETDNAVCRLLVVEDNHDLAAYIGTNLDDRYAVHYAFNGKEGLDRALELMPDLIITDLMMPEMDGLEMCRQIRRSEILNHIPLIVVTAKGTEEDRIQGLKAGADAYLAKPFNNEELRTRVEQLLNGRRLLREKFAQIWSEDKEHKTQPATCLNDNDLRFLAKVSDTIAQQLNRRKDIDVANLASSLCMSTSQLYRKVNALTGYTPTGYIQRVKIKRAKHLLDTQPQMPFNEVAERCGFNDYSNFVRAFKNVYGLTPTDYRKVSER